MACLKSLSNVSITTGCSQVLGQLIGSLVEMTPPRLKKNDRSLWPRRCIDWGTSSSCGWRRGSCNLSLSHGKISSTSAPGTRGPRALWQLKTRTFKLLPTVGRAEMLKHLESLLLTRCHAKDLWLSGPRPHIGRDLDEWDP